MGPSALTTALYAAGARAPAALAERARFTLGIAALLSLGAIVVLLCSAGWMLGWFGPAYADQGGWPLRVLSLGVLPLAVKLHYVTICRVRGQVPWAALVSVAGAALEIAAAVAGLYAGGLVGLSLGWVAGLCLEATVMLPPVWKAMSIHRLRLRGWRLVPASAW
jgi:O-antigen/teichoic acid export membrane protein